MHNPKAFLSISEIPTKSRGKPGPKPQDILQRFSRFVNKRGPRHRKLGSNCWIWKGKKNSQGYGKFSLRTANTIISAHRISWLLYMGDIPANSFVLHECDIKSCVNPKHLKIGNAKQNTQDMFDHNQTWANSKLTVAQIAEIRIKHANGMLQKDLAIAYKTSPSNISFIVNQKRWKAVLDA